MLSQCELNFGKTSKSKNYNFKTRYPKRYTRLGGKCHHWTKNNFKSVSLENVLQNNIAKSLARTHILKDIEDEPLYTKYSKIKHELKKREERIKKELENVKESLRQSLENSLESSKSQIKMENVTILQSSTDTKLSEQKIPPNNSLEKVEFIYTMQNNADLQIIAKENSIHNIKSKNTVSVQCVDEKGCSDGIYVFSKSEESGDFEIKTEHPCGSIKTYIMHSSSGNIEIITHIKDYDEEPLQAARSELCSVAPHLVVPPTSISTTNVSHEQNIPKSVKTKVQTNEFEITVTKSRQETTLDKKPSVNEIKFSNIYENVTKVLQKLNDSVVYALEQINKNLSKALESFNQNIKLVLTVVIRDEIRKVISEHLSDKKTLVCSSTSNENVTPSFAEEKEVELNENENLQVVDTTYKEIVVENSKTISCSAKITPSMRNSSVQTLAINNKVEKTTITSNAILELKLPKSTSTSEFTSEPVRNKTSEKAIEVDEKNSVEIIYDHKNEIEPRLTLSTKSTNWRSSEASVDDAKLSTKIDACIGTESNLKTSTVEVKEFKDSSTQRSSSTEVESFKFPSKSNDDFFVGIHQVTPAPSSTTVANKDQKLFSPMSLRPTKYNTPELKVKDEPNVNLPAKESLVAFFSLPNSVYSTASSSVITQALTEELTLVDFGGTNLTDDSDSDDTFVTSNFHCVSQKSLLQISPNVFQIEETVEKVTIEQPPVINESRSANPSSESDEHDSHRRNKKRRFTKPRLNRCSESLISENIHKLTVNKVLTKNNGLYVQKKAEERLQRRQTSNQLKQMKKIVPLSEIQICKGPHSPSCDCFDCVYADYCKNTRSSESDRCTKIDDSYNSFMTQKIYDTHVDSIKENFQQHEKELSKFEKKIKQACQCVKDNKKITTTNKTQQKSSFEATLSGLQRALGSLKNKLQQNDDNNQSTELNSQQRKTTATITLFQQENEVQIDNANNGKRSVGVQRKMAVRPEENRKTKRHVEMNKKKQTITPMFLRSMQSKQPKKNLRNLIRKTLSNGSSIAVKTSNPKPHKSSFTQTINSKQQELMCIRSCEQELKNFLSAKKKPYSYKKGTPNTAITVKTPSKKNETKRSSKSVFRSSTETTVHSMTASKKEKKSVPTHVGEIQTDKRNKRKKFRMGR